MERERNCNEDIKKLNYIYFNELYNVFYEKLSSDLRYKTILKNKLILFKNNLKYNYFSKYKNIRKKIDNKKDLISIIEKDIYIIENNKKEWKEIIYDIKPLIYVFIEIIKDFNEIKEYIEKIFQLNYKIINYFIGKNRRFLKYFELDELRNIIIMGLYESIYKYDPFREKEKGDMNYKEILFSGVAYNYIKKNIVDEIIERIHITSLTIEEKLKYIEYYKNLIEKDDNIEDENNNYDIIENENNNNNIEINYFNNYISLDEYVFNEDKKTKLDFITDTRNDYENVDNKLIFEKLLNYLSPEEIYAIYFTKNQSHDEDILSILNLNPIQVMINQTKYPLMAKRAFDKIKNIL